MIVDLRVHSMAQLASAVAILALTFSGTANAVSNEAHLTKVVHDVRLRGSTVPLHQASLNERVLEEEKRTDSPEDKYFNQGLFGKISYAKHLKTSGWVDGLRLLY